MEIREFGLERFFARHEFNCRHMLAASDVDGLPMAELLALADDDARHRWENLGLGYTESRGLPALREEIAALYDGLTADDVLTFVGAEEAIFLTMHARLRAGDHAVVLWPAYQSLHEVARSAGADVTIVPLDPNGWTLDVDRFIAAFRPNTRVAVVNFPHNPTGAQIDRTAFARIASECHARGITLLSDEVYRFLEHDAADLLPPAASLSPTAVSLGVMSKSFALAGLRVGWVATRDRRLLDRLVRLKDYTTICGSAPSEILSLMALRARGSILRRSREIVSRNLPILADFMARHAAHLRWSPPRAGSTCFPRFTTDVSAERAAELLIARTGVVILPGGRYQYDRSYFRIGYGRFDMPDALAAIDPLIPEAAALR